MDKLFDQKKEAKFLGSFTEPPLFSCPLLLFLGRSNSGKSSLLSSLIVNPSMVKVSSKPGATRLANAFRLGQVVLLDLPGYGYAKVSYEDREKMSQILALSLNHPEVKAAFLTHDIRRSLTQEEISLAESFREKKIPLHLVLTKVDKTNQKEFARLLKTHCDAPFFETHKVSSLKKTGLDAILNFINSLG